MSLLFEYMIEYDTRKLNKPPHIYIRINKAAAMGILEITTNNITKYNTTPLPIMSLQQCETSTTAEATAAGPRQDAAALAPDRHHRPLSCASTSA
jgi:hypothetical protein